MKRLSAGAAAFLLGLLLASPAALAQIPELPATSGKFTKACSGTGTTADPHVPCVDASGGAVPTGGATAAKQPAFGTAGTPSADVLSVQGVSGGTPQPVSPPDGCPSGQTCSGSVTSAANLFSIDTQAGGGGYQSAVVQFTSPGTGSTTTSEASLDNSTWSAVYGLLSNANAAQTISSANGTIIVCYPLTGRYFRERVSTYGSGTIAAQVTFRSAPCLPITNVVVSSGALNLTPRTANGLTNFRVNAAGTTNATSVKASGGQVYGFHLCNATASQKYFRFFNSASAPTPGSGTPTETVAIRANGCETWTSDIGIVYGTGIAYDITGANGDTDTTATAAGDVTGAVWYN
jgi:hypothetical protein